MDVRDLAAVESPCLIVVDEDLDEIEVNRYRVFAKDHLI